MAQPKPTAAQALYGHLPTGDRPERTQRWQGGLAEAMYPSLSAKRSEATQAKQRRQQMLAELHEIVRR
jgi:hypothetical protein